MSKIILYHGSPYSTLTPEYGKGQDKHDYGKGLYLTPDIELAREWAVCNETDGFLYRIDFDLDDLNVLDFDKLDPKVWIAELMSHRNADDSVRYRRFAPAFIEKYKIDTSPYDVIQGWRADSSYFLIAKRFVKDELDASLLPDALRLGDLGIQYCVKSEKAFLAIKHTYYPIEEVSMEIYLKRYNHRDSNARKNLFELIESNRNTLKDTFSNYL
ncbi:MAG: DUF3990 domain-containing protein [Blautia sp.]|nr:DUF3990 domain-containing protein [Blautia sp.]